MEIAEREGHAGEAEFAAGVAYSRVRAAVLSEDERDAQVPQ